MSAATTPAQVPIGLDVRNLWIVKGSSLISDGKLILNRVSLKIPAGHFVAIIGPNGAGKTTLLKAIVGERPSSGEILFSGGREPDRAPENFYNSPEYWLSQIGYVPVDNILHEQLTIRQALWQVGKLRLPDISDTELHKRIDTQLAYFFGSADDKRFNQGVSTLSSGERKKVNICAELLTDPALLILDEPTSNLDPDAEMDLMERLKHTAQTGGGRCTVLLVTHTLESLGYCDEAIFVANGKALEPIPTAGILSDLEARLPAGKQGDSNNLFDRWAHIFDEFKTNEERRPYETPPPTKPSSNQPEPRETTAPPFFHQLGVLLTRYFLIRSNDFKSLFVLLFLGFIAGALLVVFPQGVFLESDDATLARQSAVLYTTVVILVGAISSHREVSKEFRIYLHERLKGLSPLAYLLSKLIWLSAAVGVMLVVTILALSGTPQARLLALVLGLGLIALGLVVGVQRLRNDSQLYKPVTRWRGWIRSAWRLLQIPSVTLPLLLAFALQFQNKDIPVVPLSPMVVELLIFGFLLLTCITALMLGLLLSSIAGGNNDFATVLVIIAIIMNVVLVFSELVLSRDAQAITDLLVPLTASHWGYEGFSSSIGIYCWSAQGRIADFNSIGHFISVFLLLTAHILVSIGLGVVVLKSHDSWSNRAVLLRSLRNNRRAFMALAALIFFVLSWGIFLRQQSTDYLRLTFNDEYYSASIYAHIDNIPASTSAQRINGLVSETMCGKPE